MRLAVVIVLGGLAALEGLRAEVIDVRENLLSSQRAADEDFPDGEDVKLTHFSQVGSVVTESGEKIYVADQRGVITGMRAPRGLNYVSFFGADFRFLGKIRYVRERPLWCEGSRVFLFGEISTGKGDGNAIDLGGGFERWSVESTEAYGSLQKAD